MVSLPDSHVFELLSRFPSSTYKVIERQFEPQNPPSSGTYVSGQTIRFNLSAAVNEFVLVDSSHVQLHCAAAMNAQGTFNFNQNGNAKSRPAWRPGLSPISSIRETVNSGSLTTYELTDAKSCNWYNTMRGALARSPVIFPPGTGAVATGANAPSAGARLG